MTKAKALATFIPAFIIFLVLGAMVGGDKNPEKQGSNSTSKETVSESKPTETQDNLSLFKKAVQDKDYYAAYHLLSHP